jgi:6-phosphogluconolactonase
LAAATSSAISQSAEQAPRSLWVFIGTYTGRTSEGIYLSRLDLKTGELSAPRLVGKLPNPSFLAIHPSRKFLYAVSEIDDFQGKKTGAIAALQIDPKTGDLTLLNKQPSKGAGPCHVVVDAAGEHVLAANYSGGSVVALPIEPSGALREASGFVQHEGTSVNPDRQEGPHAHSINLDRANRFAFAADLGLDKVLIYRFDGKGGTLAANDPPHVEVTPGAGPRHFAFHPSGKFAYVINELDLTITAFAYDGERGALTVIDSQPTLPAGASREGASTAEVQVHPSGKFVYGSNRGHHSIAIFQVDEQTGKLTPAGHALTRGKTPRNFAVDPTGQFLLAGNQDSDTIAVFRIDQSTGALTPVGEPVAAPMPVCLRMIEPL